MWECSSEKQKPGTWHYSQSKKTENWGEPESKDLVDNVAGPVLPG